MSNIDRKSQFIKMYYKWIIDCLTEDENYEVLAFFQLGCDICVRQKELLSIEWSQINFPYIHNIENSTNKYPYFYSPLNVSNSTIDTINKLWTENTDTNTRIFKHNLQWYINAIRESSGDIDFNGHMMRRIGIVLKCDILGK